MLEILAFERQRLVVVFISYIVIGWITQYWSLSAIAVLLVYLLWHASQLFQLLRWLKAGAKTAHAPDVSGVWEQVLRYVYAVQRRNQQRKKHLRSLVKRSRKIAASLPDGAIVLTPNDEIDWANRKAESLVGIKHPADVRQRIDNLIRDPEFRVYLQKRDYEESLNINSPKDDKLELNIRIIPFGEGERLLIARDVSSYVRIQTMRRNFVANVSHELKTPLTVIHGYLESLLDDEEFDKAYQPVLQSIHQQTLRMHSIVEDLLELSKLESSPTIADNIEVRVSTVLNAFVNEAQQSAQDSGHSLLVDIDNNLNLYSREKELTSLVSNLVYNAFRYTPAGTQVKIQWYLEETGNAVLAVEDNGPGIEPEHIDRLTERFYRVDSGRSRDAGGSGLGLSIVKHIMLSHKGRLEVASTLGEGSSFQCIFPAERIIRS